MTEQRVTLDMLYETRERVMRRDAPGGAPAGVGVWLVSGPARDQIAKLDGVGNLAYGQAEAGELARLFGAPIVPLDVDGWVVAFRIACRACGAWLRIDEDARCSRCGMQIGLTPDMTSARQRPRRRASRHL